MKKKVAVIFGGPSREHDVSLDTGKEMSAGLDREQYEVHDVLITKHDIL